MQRVAILILLMITAAPTSVRAGISLEQNDYKLTINARIVGEVGYLTNPSVPQEGFTLYAGPKPPRDRDFASVSARQSGMTFIMEAPSLGSFQTLGVIDFNLMGSDPGAGRPGAFFQRAYAQLQNDRWGFVFGKTAALVAPLRPQTLNWSGLEQGGDLNSSAPRDILYAEFYAYAQESGEFTIQAGVSNPENDFLVAVPNRTAENDGVPNVEARFSAQIGNENSEGQRPLALGISGFVGRIRAEDPTERLADSTWAAAIDLALRASRVGVRGEVWKGRGLGSYGGAIGQTGSDSSDRAIAAYGFWAEVFVQLDERWEVNVAGGLDDPQDDQLSPNMRSRNQVYLGTVMFAIAPPFTLGAEFRHYETNYISPARNNIINVFQFLVRYEF